MKISAVYKITNTVTGDFYIGSSKDVKQRWRAHKCPSSWKRLPNNKLYQDMRKYGVDNFDFQILEVVEPEELKEKEQKFIELLKPAYNDRNANGLNIERQKETKKEYHKEYQKTEKGKESHKKAVKEYNKEYQKEYQKSDKYKDYQKEYHKSDKCKKYQKEYHKQLCFYNGETLTLNALSKRFRRRGLFNPMQEAKKYLI